jgi:glycosyltransferase involved in cell wall biosynthesis
MADSHEQSVLHPTSSRTAWSFERKISKIPQDAKIMAVSVVIPTLNEAANLPHVFERLPEGLKEVIVVDGNSTDGTVEAARRLRPDVRIVHQVDQGKGDALARGFAAATGDAIVMMDADGSNDPAEIPRFIEALEFGADFAKGSRTLEGGGSADLTPFRRFGNWVLSTTVNVLYGTKYSDLCYGYNAFRRACLDYLNVDCSGFEVETLVNIRVAQLGLRVQEVPSYEGHRIHGSSKLSPVRDGWRILKVIVRERVAPKSNTEAMPIFRSSADPEHPYPVSIEAAASPTE